MENTPMAEEAKPKTKTKPKPKTRIVKVFTRRVYIPYHGFVEVGDEYTKEVQAAVKACGGNVDKFLKDK